MARNTEDQETNELAEIYWLANQFPESELQQVQELAQSYARVVIEEEWPMMQDGGSSDRAWSLMDQIRQSIGESEPSTSAEQVLNPFARNVRLSPVAFKLVLHRFGENKK